MEHRLAPPRIALGRLPPGLCSALLHRYKLERRLCTFRQAVHTQFGAQTPLPFPAAADDSGQQHLNRFRLMLAVILGRARMRTGKRTRRRTGGRTGRGTLLLASRRTGRRTRRWTGRRARRRARQRTWHTFILVHRRPCGGTRLTTFRLLGLPARRAVTLMVHHCYNLQELCFWAKHGFSVERVSLHCMISSKNRSVPHSRGAYFPLLP
jgi:hypothetical protein